jgi:serine/threonine protein phosphatase PrpC
LYGVFDGHGPNGHDVSDLAVKFLVKTFFEQENFSDDTGKAFTVAFRTAQQEIEKAKVDATSSGSTCTMAFHNIEKDVLTLAHVGDSRGVLYAFAPDCSNQLDGAMGHIKHQTEDHKPNLPKEKARIEAGGGRVVFDGYFNHRVFAKAGMYPGLNMSRALGDILAHKEAGLTAEPEVKEFAMKDLRKSGKKLFLVICSDGVWEFIDSKDALKEGFDQGSSGMVPNYLDPGFKKGVDSLAKKSWDKWMADSDNEISDDISVIAAFL